MKYTALIETFKPGSDEDDYVIIMEKAHQIIKTIHMRMTDPLTANSFLNYTAQALSIGIKNVEEALKETSDTEEKSMLNNTLGVLTSTRKMMTENRDTILKSFKDRDLTDRETLIALAGNDGKAKTILSSPLVNTIGDLLVAVVAQSLNQ